MFSLQNQNAYLLSVSEAITACTNISLLALQNGIWGGCKDHLLIAIIVVVVDRNSAATMRAIHLKCLHRAQMLIEIERSKL